MKKRFMLVIGLTAIANINYAQVHISGYGFKGGINVYKFTNSSVATLKNVSAMSGISVHNAHNVGINFGGVLQIAITDKLMVQPQLLYSQLGSKITLSGNTATAAIAHKLDYLGIPITVKYNFTGNISAFAGPQISFLLRAKRNFVGDDGMGTRETININIKDKMKPMDFAGLVGIEYTLPKQGLLFSAGFQIGLTDVAKTKTNSDEGDSINSFLWDPLKLSAFNFTIGYIFKSPKENRVLNKRKSSKPRQ